MKTIRQESRSQSYRRTLAGTVCPACGSALPANAQACGSCGFSGGDTMAMFPGPPPPLMPLLDAADLWTTEDLRRIEAARQKLRRRYPQFHFHVCTVMLPPETSLPVFGFWLLNVCPYYVNESAEDRAWAVLLLINARTGQAAVIPAYAAEGWLGDAEWKKAIASMSTSWKSGNSAQAVIRFFESSVLLLDRSWKLRGLRPSKKSMS